jgi:hypothetical protein
LRCRFIGISKDDENNLLIVMEFVPGGELYPLLQNEEIDMDWPLRLRVCAPATSTQHDTYTHVNI